MSEHDTTTEGEAVEGTTDFDAFWEGRDRKRKPVRIMGVVTHLPPAIPLQFEMEARKLSRSKSDKDVRKLVGILFGKDAMATWAEAGMDSEQFMVLLAWAPRVIAGQAITLAEVADEVAAELRKGDATGDPS